MVCLQCNNCVIHSWALQRQASHIGALYDYIHTCLFHQKSILFIYSYKNLKPLSSINTVHNVVAMHIQLSQSMFIALLASQLGYVMRQRGELEIKVRVRQPCLNVTLFFLAVNKWLSKVRRCCTMVVGRVKIRTFSVIFKPQFCLDQKSNYCYHRELYNRLSLEFNLI